MEYTESSKGILEKMITNETLAKMTRSSHFNPKSGVSNGFRSPMLPSHLNGKTISGLTSGSKCSVLEQPRRSVITLKNAPGPPVNSSGTGVLKTKSCITTLDRSGSDSKAGGVRGGRSRKRSRDADTPEVLNCEERKNGCVGPDHSTSASENVEPTRRKRRGQSSKRIDKKNGQLPPMGDAALPKYKASNSAGVTGILDSYGLKAKPLDISRLMIDTPLDSLLSGKFERHPSFEGSPAVVNGSGDGECRLVFEEMSNVMQLLPKHTFIQKPFVENALNEDVKVRLMLDLERPLQPEDSHQIEDRHESIHRLSSLDKVKSKSLELFPTFVLDDLPMYPIEVLLDRIKLPANDSLETLISYSRPTDHAGSATERTSGFEGIPPSPFSFSPCGVRSDVDYGRASRNGRAAERQWNKTGSENTSKAKMEQATVKTESGEATEVKNASGIESKSSVIPVTPKEEVNIDRDESSVCQKEQERGVEKNKHSLEVTRKTELPALQLKREENEAANRRSSSGIPAMPCSPGVQAATILCNMANSDEREFIVRGKRHNDEEHSQRVSKLAKVEDRHVAHNQDINRKENPCQPVKKSPVSEKRKSLSQVNHSLSSVTKRAASTSSWVIETGAARSISAVKSEDHQRESSREMGKQATLKPTPHSSKPSKDSNSNSANIGPGRTTNGVLKAGNGVGLPNRSPKATPRREASVVSRSSRSSFVSSEAVGPRTATGSIKSSSSSRRACSATSSDGKSRSKHDLRACTKLSSRD